VDGREVHFSQAGSWERSFDFPFSVRVADVGSVHARLIADSAPGARPYDLLINGMSYFHFSKIYELGTPSMRVGQMDSSNVTAVSDEPLHTMSILTVRSRSMLSHLLPRHTLRLRRTLKLRHHTLRLLVRTPSHRHWVRMEINSGPSLFLSSRP
jgi:hypothetical protein